MLYVLSDVGLWVFGLWVWGLVQGLWCLVIALCVQCVVGLSFVVVKVLVITF